MVQVGDTVELKHAGHILEGIIMSIEMLQRYSQTMVNVVFSIQNVRYTTQYEGTWTTSTVSPSTSTVSSSNSSIRWESPVVSPSASPSSDSFLYYRPTYDGLQPDPKFNVMYSYEEFKKLQPKNTVKVEIKDDEFWLK